MAVTALDEIIIFDLVNGLIKIKDQTDWAAGGVTLGTDAVGINLKVELINSTTLTLYDNLSGATFDIVPNTSLYNINNIQLPLDSDGNVVIGTYKVTAVAEITPAAASDPPEYYVTQIVSYYYNVELPEACLTHQVNCISATVTGRDETVYGTDEANIVRENNLYPPPALAPVQGGTQPVFIYNGGTYQMWTGTWTHEVISDVTYSLSSAATIIYRLEATVEFQVDCDTTLCKIRCCIEKLGKRWINAQKTNPKEALNILNTQINPLTWYVEQWILARECGNVDDMAKFLAEIKEVSGCKGNCNGCNADEPQLIVPITGGGSSVIVDSPLGSVTVTPETIGTTQYFHLEVAAWILTIINNLSPVAVSTDTPTYLTVTPTVIAGVLTYVITFIPAAIGLENHIEIRGKINRNPNTAAGQPFFIFTPVYIYTSGAQVNPSSSYVFTLGTSTPNLSTDEMVLAMSGFKNSVDNLSYTVKCQLMRKHPTRSVAMVQIEDMQVEPCWFDTTADDFTIRFFNPTSGIPKKFSDVIPTDTEIYFSISIYIKPTL